MKLYLVWEICLHEEQTLDSIYLKKTKAEERLRFLIENNSSTNIFFEIEERVNSDKIYEH